VFVTPARIVGCREAIETAYEELFKGSPVSDMAIKGVDIHVAGNLGVQRSRSLLQSHDAPRVARS